jgi:hypothetical protein
MKIRCKVCEEFFSTDEEASELMSEGYIETVDTCDECWDMLNHLYDVEDMISDADPGL